MEKLKLLLYPVVLMTVWAVVAVYTVLMLATVPRSLNAPLADAPRPPPAAVSKAQGHDNS